MDGTLDLSQLGIELARKLATERGLIEREALEMVTAAHRSNYRRKPPSMHCFVIHEVSKLREAFEPRGIKIPRKRNRAPGWQIPEPDRQRLAALLQAKEHA